MHQGVIHHQVEQAGGVQAGDDQDGDVVGQVGGGPGGAAEEVVEAVEGVPLRARYLPVGVDGLDKVVSPLLGQVRVGLALGVPVPGELGDAFVVEG